jgi:adenine-specific DNA-methyltransferase
VHQLNILQGALWSPLGVGSRSVGIYDPLTGKVLSTQGEDVAAWLLDTDCDTKPLHICQAPFPSDRDA